MLVLLAAWPAAAVNFAPLTTLHVVVDALPPEASTESHRVGPMRVAFAGAAEMPRLARPAQTAPAALTAVAEPPRARSAGGSRQSEIAQQLQRLEEQMAAGNRVIAEMLERVSGMEREVAEMRARVQSLPGVAATGGTAAVEPAAPVARQPSAAEADTAVRYKRTQVIIVNGLLLLAAGVLLLLIGVAYWTWGRPVLKDRLREARAGRTAAA